MQFTRLGTTGTTVSRIALGCMSFGSRAWRPWVLERDEALPFFRRAVELGINFFDTADIYSLGASEEVTGARSASSASRDELVIATKVRFKMTDGPNMGGLSRKHILQACDAEPPPARRRRRSTSTRSTAPTPTTPVEETLAALDHLVRQGKVRYIGASSMYAWQLMKALVHLRAQRLGAVRLDAEPLQPRLPRGRARDDRRSASTRASASFPGRRSRRGMLGGNRKRGDHSTSARDTGDARLADQLYDQPSDWDVVDATVAVAKARGVQPAQVALAWLLSRPGVTAPIVGTTQPGTARGRGRRRGYAAVARRDRRPRGPLPATRRPRLARRQRPHHSPASGQQDLTIPLDAHDVEVRERSDRAERRIARVAGFSSAPGEGLWDALD